MELAVERYRQRVGDSTRLANAVTGKLALRQLELGKAAAKLDALSPLKTLDRGYAIVTDTNGHVIDTAGKVSTGDTIQARLANGSLTAEVTEVKEDTE